MCKNSHSEAMWTCERLKISYKISVYFQWLIYAVKLYDTAFSSPHMFWWKQFSIIKKSGKKNYEKRKMLETPFTCQDYDICPTKGIEQIVLYPVRCRCVFIHAAQLHEHQLSRDFSAGRQNFNNGNLSIHKYTLGFEKRFNKNSQTI